MPTRKADRIEVENVVSPGRVYRVDRTKYEAMRRAYLKAAPKSPPGLTIAEIQGRLLAHLPEDLFPGGAQGGLVCESRPARSRGQGHPRPCAGKPGAVVAQRRCGGDPPLAPGFPISASTVTVALIQIKATAVLCRLSWRNVGTHHHSAL